MLDIKYKVYVNFGDVFINGVVKVGIKKENGCEVPDMQPRKVFIGNLTFIVGDSKVTVKNNTIKDTSMVHPHSNEGKICFGTAETEVLHLLGTLQLSKLIKLLYSWAYSYNDKSTYVKLQRFYDYYEKGEKDEEY